MLKSLIPYIPYIIVILGLIWMLYQLKPIVFDWWYWNDYEYIKQRTIELDHEKAAMGKKALEFMYQFQDLDEK